MFVIGLAFSFHSGCGTVDPGEEETIGRLNSDTFKASIQAVLDSRGCSQGGCHFRDKDNPNQGGPGGSLRIFDCTQNSCTDGQILANHDSASGMVNISNPAGAKLLTKPLIESGGGLQHLGGDIFLNRSDPDYVAILGWIENPL